MNWDDVKLFLAVAREPRLGHAATNSSLDPTTLSRRLRRLESDVGLTLFERTRRGHVLTSAGEDFAKRAEAMEAASRSLGEISTPDAPSLSGQIRIGVTEGLGAVFLAPMLSKFSAPHPELQVDLIALSGFVSVPKRQADMSILLSRPSKGRMKVRKLVDYELGLYASPHYLGTSPALNRASDLHQHRLVGYVDDLIYSPKLRYLNEIQPKLRVQLASPSIVAQQAMISSGGGVGVLPKFMAEQSGALTRVLEETVSIQRSFWLVIHEDVSHFSRIRSLTDFLTDLFSRSQRTFRKIN